MSETSTECGTMYALSYVCRRHHRNIRRLRSLGYRAPRPVYSRRRKNERSHLCVFRGVAGSIEDVIIRHRIYPELGNRQTDSGSDIKATVSQFTYQSVVARITVSHSRPQFLDAQFHERITFTIFGGLDRFSELSYFTLSQID